jgi:penicillin-binding protein 1A
VFNKDTTGSFFVSLLPMIKKHWKQILIITGSAAAIVVVFILIVFIGALRNLQSEKQLLNYKNANASVVLSQEGEMIGKIFAQNRTNILYEQIPTNLINALIATEDARFYEHKGVDSRSLFRVLFKTILFNRQSSGGGSTITQQLAKNMFGRKNTSPFAIFINKTKEVFLARRLEKVLSKNEILTLYLNTVPFGENVFGIEAAALRYFGKSGQDLLVEESAVLIGMLKANNLYNPRLNPENAKNRRNIVLGQMTKYKYLQKTESDSLNKLPLKLNYSNIESGGPADYFLYQVKNDTRKILDSIFANTGKKWNIEEDGLVITTTLNLRLQEIANKSFHDHLSEMQKRLNKQYESNSGKKFIGNLADSELKKYKLTEKADEVAFRQIFDWDSSYSSSISVADSLKQTIKLLQAGLLAINPVTGAVKAWVGGIDFKTQPYDQILARRQMGSTFKPILYAEAIEEGIRPCFYLDNDSIVISGPKDWSPENYDLTHGGKYSLTGALVHSMNIPTFNLFLKVGFGSLDSLWRKMGFSFALDNTPSLAMGTAEASIKELAVAYSAFTNGGYKITPQNIVSIKSPTGEIIWQNEFLKATLKILSERTCTLMNVILQKAIREGTGNPLNSVYGISMPMAGKTGTTQDYADAWFVSYNPSLVMISRVGASLPSVHFSSGSNGSGSTLALPLVGMTLKKVQADPGLRAQFFSLFPELSPELAGELDCPDFRDKNVLENIINIFKKDRFGYDSTLKKHEIKRKSFFRRLFGRKNRN